MVSCSLILLFNSLTFAGEYHGKLGIHMSGVLGSSFFDDEGVGSLVGGFLNADSRHL